jgi:hypothetical protein
MFWWTGPSIRCADSTFGWDQRSVYTVQTRFPFFPCAVFIKDNGDVVRRSSKLFGISARYNKTVRLHHGLAWLAMLLLVGTELRAAKLPFDMPHDHVECPVEQFTLSCSVGISATGNGDAVFLPIATAPGGSRDFFLSGEREDYPIDGFFSLQRSYWEPVV